MDPLAQILKGLVNAKMVSVDVNTLISLSPVPKDPRLSEQSFKTQLRQRLFKKTFCDLSIPNPAHKTRPGQAPSIPAHHASPSQLSPQHQHRVLVRPSLTGQVDIGQVFDT